MGTISDQITTLQQVLNDALPSTDNAQPMEIFNELLLLRNNRPIEKKTNMRSLVRHFISKEADKKIPNIPTSYEKDPDAVYTSITFGLIYYYFSLSK